VVIDIKQRSPLFPPVHFVPAGILTAICSLPADAGAATPFFVIALAAAALKLLPVPVESMDKLLTAREPSVPPLKFVMVMATVPSAAAFTGVDVSTAVSAAVPHGLAVEGR
jgi:hypothetical protein